jgi:DNA polymerase (family X)
MIDRLLLGRKGYSVDRKKIIDECATNNVVIEINAHLDAHVIEEF